MSQGAYTAQKPRRGDTAVSGLLPVASQPHAKDSSGDSGLPESVRKPARSRRTGQSARVHVPVAQQASLSSKKETVPPNLLRHTTAMKLLGSGVAPTGTALWLGHESLETTSVYLHADLQRSKSPRRRPLL